MINVRFVGIGLIFTLVSLSACTGTGAKDLDLEIGEKATIGATAGGVVGAGLGAIVGNQVGNTGTGLVLGAVVGAGSGGMVGHALDGQDKRMQTQEEQLQQQERQLAAQKSQLQELSGTGMDNVSFKSQIQSKLNAQGNNFSQGQVQDMQQSSVMPDARANYNWPTRSTGSQNSMLRSANTYIPKAALPTNRQPVARVQEKNLVDHSNINSRQHEAFSNQAYASRVQPAAASVVNPIEEVPAWQEPEVRNKIEETINTLPIQQAANTQIQDNNSPTLAEARIAAPVNLASPECKQAVDEAGSARSAADPADKLYHYRRALRLCPDNADFHNELGKVYLGLNRKEDAKYEFQEALRLQPGHAAASAAVKGL